MIRKPRLRPRSPRIEFIDAASCILSARQHADAVLFSHRFNADGTVRTPKWLHEDEVFCKARYLPLTCVQLRPENPDLAKILIVDDDSAVQMTIGLLLERAGHSVVTAGDGRKGLALFETSGFDLLFLDIFMPGMDGFETMRMVHQLRPLVPIIVISGRPVASDAGCAPDFLTMATKLGAVSSLQKPFKPAALLAAVADCLEAAKRRSSASSHAPGGVASCP